MNEPTSFQIKLNNNAQMAVGATATIYSDAFQFGDADYFALSYIVTCSGVPNIKIQMEQALTKPTVPNGADTAYGIPKTVADIETTLTSKLIQHMQLMPVTIPYVRFKIVEQAGNSDSIVQMWLTLQKKHTM